MVDLTPGFNLGITNALANLVGVNDNPNRAALTTTPGDIAAAQFANGNVGTWGTTPTQSVADNNAGTYTTDSSANSALATPTNAQTLATLDSQSNDLNSLLGRTDTGLNQGLSQLNNSYTSNVNQQQNQENQALQDYADSRTQTNQDKLGAYDQINQNENNGYNSLAQIIGRSAGTGSSAFQDLLPNVIGKDTSAKRGTADTTYATNLGSIDDAQAKTQNSFANILADLANQRAQQEQTLRTGVEQQKQNLDSQLQSVAAQKAEAQGGGYAQVAAAEQPFQSAIDSSRDAVQNFFNQFQPTVTPQQAAIAAPSLAGYAVDRSNVNAADSGVADPTNPYADILRKKLQDDSSA